jgi:outer membrane protein OmpA-like peptidoglycan-associated protein
MGQPFNSSHDDVAFICKPNGRAGYFSSNRDNGEGNDKVYFFIDNKMLAETKPVVVASAETKKIKPTSETAIKKPTPEVATKKISPKIISRVNDDELLQLIFDRVYFNFNDASVHASSYVTLDSAIQAIHQSKTVKIAVNAHTDSRGSAPYNQALSNKRANAVKQYLLKKGVPASRIITHGLGETQLLNSCTDGVECTDEQHQQNRRVEIRIVK